MLEHTIVINLEKLTKSEMGLFIQENQLPYTVDDLFRKKMDGFNKLYFDVKEKQILFYTTNRDKRTLQVGDFLKNKLNGLVPLHSTISKHEREEEDSISNREASEKVRVDSGISTDEIEERLNQLYEKVMQTGSKSLTDEEKEFLVKYT